MSITGGSTWQLKLVQRRGAFRQRVQWVCAGQGRRDSREDGKGGPGQEYGSCRRGSFQAVLLHSFRIISAA